MPAVLFSATLPVMSPRLSPYVAGARCFACGTAHDLTTLLGVCTACGMPLRIDYDLAAMRLACDPIIGEHDFTSFCRVPRRQVEVTMVRRVVDARWVDLGDGLLRFDVEASSFCQQMVRSLVGLCYDVGRGFLPAESVRDVIESGDRSRVATVAPPHGLTLWEVGY